MPGNQIFKIFLILLIIICIGCSQQDAGKMPITTNSDEAKTHFLNGRELFEKLRLQESLQPFEKAIEKDSAFALAYFYFAQAQPNQKGFYEQMNNALLLVDKVSEAESNLILGLQSATNGDPLAERNYYQKVVDAYPQDERAHNFLADNYYGQQEYEKAVTEYKKAVEINPNFSPAYNSMGYVNRFMGKNDEAEKAFKKYIELIPEDPNPYDSYAELLMKIGKYEESNEQYSAALKNDSNFWPSYVGIATNLNYLDRHAHARVQCQMLYDIARNDREKRIALFTMAVSFIDEGNWSKAIEKMDKRYSLAKKIDDSANMSADLNEIAEILCEMGKGDEAIEKCNMSYKAIQESGLSEEVIENARIGYLNYEALIALKQGDFKSAKSKAKEYWAAAEEKKNPTQIRSCYGTMGRIAMEEKDYVKALEYFQKANLQNPYHLYRTAVCYQALGDTENAIAYCEKVVNFNALNSLNYAFCRTKAKEMLTSLK